MDLKLIRDYLNARYETLNISEQSRVLPRSRDEVYYCYVRCMHLWFNVVHSKFLTFSELDYHARRFLRNCRISAPRIRIRRELYNEAVFFSCSKPDIFIARF